MANEELLQKLRRQRLRMGEDPLPVPTRQLDHTKERHSRRDELVSLEKKGEVMQRARKFQSTDSPGPSPSRTPGRINLDCWEQRCREKTCPSQSPCANEARHQHQDVASLATIREEAKTGHALVDTISEEAWTEEAWAETERKTVSHLGTPRDGMQDVTLPEGEAKGKKAPEAECFCMWDSEEECMAQDASSRSAEADAEEPLEFSMLDYLAELPEGVAEKLQRCLKTHEELVRRLCQRNELLQAQVRNIRCDGLEAKVSPMTPQQSSRSPPFSPMSRKSPQAASVFSNVRVAHKSEARLAKPDISKVHDSIFTDRARLRDEHDVIEANLRARLQRTIKASKERVQAMQRRVEREELQVKNRFEVAMQTREGMERSIKAALKEHSLAKVRITALEEAISVDIARCRSKEKEREQLLDKQTSLRNELKALRSRASKHQKCERHIQDLQRELEALTKACHSESPRWAV
ncbi:mcm5-a [Symbiodinium natans]|uniref:Mcm5-a protein n=1 Tax=Symbiodinium natans TaxID=878477 RepID=A0A812JM17_9DINO|nr:mcm5-a [Symbiodinium natans]